MKRAIRMNGWSFSGDERTVRTSIDKLMQKGLELQLTEVDDVVVGKLELNLVRDQNKQLTLKLKVEAYPEQSFYISDIKLEKNGREL